jgi:hypothetical protein
MNVLPGHSVDLGDVTESGEWWQGPHTNPIARTYTTRSGGWERMDCIAFTPPTML